MTLLGKIFTGLVAILSIVFFVVSVIVNATHINQKEEAAKYQKQAADAATKNQQLTTLLEEIKVELAIEQTARRSALSSLQTQLAAIQTELQSQEADLAQKEAQLTALNATTNLTQQQLAAKTADNDLLREQIKQAREDRNQLFQRLVQSKDDLNRLQGDFNALEKRERQLIASYTGAKEKLEILGITPDTLLEAPPAVNGQVLAVSTSGMVEISLGRDDGLREGFTLDVHRSGQYLGRVIVRTVRDDKSVAEIMTGYQKGNIRAGDRVDSKLY